jgi:hypothetical protein
VRGPAGAGSQSAGPKHAGWRAHQQTDCSVGLRLLRPQAGRHLAVSHVSLDPCPSLLAPSGDPPRPTPPHAPAPGPATAAAPPGVVPEEPCAISGVRIPAVAAQQEEDAAAALTLWGGQAGLFNAQPYRQPAHLRVPEPPGGCARACRFACDRKSHGTGAGAGCTSNAGFWIPATEPDAEEAAAAAAAASAAAASAVRRPGRKPKRGGYALKPPSGRPTPAQVKPIHFDPEGPEPPAVALLDLPEGTPERVDVVCNGRYATFLVRPQRVEAAGEEMAPSRFEAACGRGDAKKWKTSLYERLKGDGQGRNLGVSVSGGWFGRWVGALVRCRWPAGGWVGWQERSGGRAY